MGEDDRMPKIPLTPETKAKRKAAKKALAQARELALPGSADAAAIDSAKRGETLHAARLAQIVNLHIAGFSLAQIGAQIGASADEVDRMIQRDAARYVRSQPQLRVYVRNYISERYTKLLEANWDEATDRHSPKKLENQDRVIRVLDSMRKLHGADAPTQAEVKVEAAPEAVEALVKVLSAQQGLGYDESIFDVIDAEVVHEMVSESEDATLDAGEMVGESDEAGDGTEEEWDE